MKPGRIHWGENSPGGNLPGGKFDQVRIHRGAFHIKCIRWKIFEQIGLVWLIFTFFNCNVRNRYSCRGVRRTLSNKYA